MSPERRGLLRGLVTLPLIGGGVTLIGRSCAAGAHVPLTEVAAAPLAVDPHQRARYAWEAFAAAMRDVTAGSTGWFVSGGERVQAVGYMDAHAPWVTIKAFDTVPLERSQGLIDVSREIRL